MAAEALAVVTVPGIRQDVEIYRDGAFRAGLYLSDTASALQQFSLLSL